MRNPNLGSAQFLLEEFIATSQPEARQFFLDLIEEGFKGHYGRYGFSFAPFEDDPGTNFEIPVTTGFHSCLFDELSPLAKAAMAVTATKMREYLTWSTPRTWDASSLANAVQPHEGKTMGKIKILFLAANPIATNPLQLGREAREIEEKLRGTKERDKLELITKWALRPDDLQQYLLEHRPHVVHFSGHGSDSNELILEDENGKPKPLGQPALLALFRALKDNIRMVVLNACFSRHQAEAITELIDCAIGMNRAIGDQAAITFAASLYRALGFGRSVKTAYDLGKASLLAEGIPEETTPVLLASPAVDISALVLVK